MEGVYMPPPAMIYGLSAYRGTFKEVDLSVSSKDATGRNTADAVDYKIREYRHFAHLALQNNPNILNCLFVNDENVLFEDSWGEALRGHAGLFVHQGAYDRFMGYAHSQRMKMGIKPGNYRALIYAESFLGSLNRDEVLANVIGMADVNMMKDGGPGKHIAVGDINLERGLRVRKALVIIRGRLERASARAELWDKFGFDLKFASNLIQILMEGLDLIRYERLIFPLKGAKEILAIKRGEFTAEDIHKRAEGIEDEIRAAMLTTSLPVRPRFEEVDRFVQSGVESWLRYKEI
jgi:hypothetical protein